MPLPTSGPLSLNDIQTEFGGTNPIELNEYYAGGGLVPAGTTGTFGAVPSSGTIGIQNFYGTAKQFIFYSWGQGTNGQLGDNTAVDKSSPVLVVGGFTDWISIAGGGNSTNGGGIRNNGTAWSWGVNSSGQLGDGTTINRSSPVLVIGGITDWKQMSFGAATTAAVRNNGTAWSWGNGFGGRLGDGTTINKSSPVLVAGGFTDWKQISAGLVHCAAVRNNGTAYCWGAGNFGRLGDGTTTNKNSPVLVAGGITDWKQISVNTTNGVAVRNNGTAWSWGSNSTAGFLGDGTTINRSSPVLVIGGITDWNEVFVSGGANFAAIRNNGTVWGWGFNSFGQIGDGTTTTRSSPVLVLGGFTNWKQINVSNRATMAIKN